MCFVRSDRSQQFLENLAHLCGTMEAHDAATWWRTVQDNNTYLDEYQWGFTSDFPCHTAVEIDRSARAWIEHVQIVDHDNESIDGFKTWIMEHTMDVEQCLYLFYGRGGDADAACASWYWIIQNGHCRSQAVLVEFIGWKQWHDHYCQTRGIELPGQACTKHAVWRDICGKCMWDEEYGLARDSWLREQVLMRGLVTLDEMLHRMRLSIRDTNVLPPGLLDMIANYL